MPVLRHSQLHRSRRRGRHTLLRFRQEEHYIRRVFQVAAFFERIQRGAAFAIAIVPGTTVLRRQR